jgi:hypothetical protein
MQLECPSATANNRIAGAFLYQTRCDMVEIHGMTGPPRNIVSAYCIAAAHRDAFD